MSDKSKKKKGLTAVKVEKDFGGGGEGRQSGLR
jgi:hypothetical protein